MARLTLTLLSLLPAIEAATLFVSHFEGSVYTLSLSDDASELTVASQVQPGGMPSWLTLDSTASTLYVTDESWLGGTKISAWSVGEGGELTAAGETPTEGGEIASCLFGGEDGESFIAAAQLYVPRPLSLPPLPEGRAESRIERTGSLTRRTATPAD